MSRNSLMTVNKRVDRRNFLYVGAAGLAGLSLGNALRQSAAADRTAPQAKNVIMIFLTGGPATIDMWDMKPDAPQKIRGEFQPRDTSVEGVRICEHFPKLAANMHLVALVRSLTHTIAEHTQGTAYLMTGNRPSPANDYPSLGSLSASLLAGNKGMPAYVTVGTVPSPGAGDLGAALNPFEVSLTEGRGSDTARDRIGLPSGFTVADLERRRCVLERLDRRMREFDSAGLPPQLDRFQQEALDILRSDKINKSLDIDSDTTDRRDKFGPTFLGRSALAASRLIEAGARFVTIGLGDWDTHANNFTRLRTTLLPQLDQGLAALLGDLDERGLLQETIVYCTGEFGRTPVVNDAEGRDHWARTMTALVAGGAVHRGIAYGATDDEGYEPRDRACSPDDLSATIFHQLGFPPGRQVVTRGGRPVPLFRNGHVLESLIG
jgi:hypothetical protein